MPIYGREALNYLLSVNDRYPVIYLDDIFGSALQIFSHCLFGGHFEKRLAVLAVFSGNFNSLEETSTIKSSQKSTSICFSSQRYPEVDLEFS